MVAGIVLCVRGGTRDGGEGGQGEGLIARTTPECETVKLRATLVGPLGIALHTACRAHGVLLLPCCVRTPPRPPGWLPLHRCSAWHTHRHYSSSHV